MPLQNATMPAPSTRLDTPLYLSQYCIMKAPEAKKSNAAGRLIIRIWTQETLVRGRSPTGELLVGVANSVSLTS